jgi:hypothetical protein
LGKDFLRFDPRSTGYKRKIDESDYFNIENVFTTRQAIYRVKRQAIE